MYQPTPQMQSPHCCKTLDLSNWCISPLTLEAIFLIMLTGETPLELGTSQMLPGMQPIIQIMMLYWWLLKRGDKVWSFEFAFNFLLRSEGPFLKPQKEDTLKDIPERSKKAEEASATATKPAVKTTRRTSSKTAVKRTRGTSSDEIRIAPKESKKETPTRKRKASSAR